MSLFPIDRRQRRAAVLCLMAVDLPQEAHAYTRHMAQAARLFPDMRFDEMPPLDGQARRACLQLARTLIDDMLAEIA